MALAEETKRIVGSFDLSDADLNTGVKEFLRQMGEFSLPWASPGHALPPRGRPPFFWPPAVFLASSLSPCANGRAPVSCGRHFRLLTASSIQMRD